MNKIGDLIQITFLAKKKHIDLMKAANINISKWVRDKIDEEFNPEKEIKKEMELLKKRLEIITKLNNNNNNNVK